MVQRGSKLYFYIALEVILIGGVIILVMVRETAKIYDGLCVVEESCVAGDKNSELIKTPSVIIQTLLKPLRIEVYIASTTQAHITGLSKRSHLQPQKGMLFIYERAEFPGIWMKDMQFPIDVVWIDETLRIVDIKEKIMPDSYPTIYYPQTAALYVLELNDGFVSKYGMLIGDTVTLHLAR